LLILLTLRGTSVLYYGDELAMRQVAIPAERVLDVNGRDGARTPMPWGDVDWRAPWLPVGETVRSVAQQQADATSVLRFTRALIALRRARDDLVAGGYAPLDSPPGVWCWRRGEATAVAVNLSDVPAPLELGGEVLISTTDGLDASRLEPWAGVVLALS
jgi:alpha-glucosidase